MGEEEVQEARQVSVIQAHAHLSLVHGEIQIRVRVVTKKAKSAAMAPRWREEEVALSSRVQKTKVARAPTAHLECLRAHLQQAGAALTALALPREVQVFLVQAARQASWGFPCLLLQAPFSCLAEVLSPSWRPPLRLLLCAVWELNPRHHAHEPSRRSQARAYRAGLCRKERP
jgi:hypothetical protein